MSLRITIMVVEAHSIRVNRLTQMNQFNHKITAVVIAEKKIEIVIETKL